MDRLEYLSQIWTPYPAMPSSYKVAGRIFEIDTKDKFTLTIQRDQRLHTVAFDKTPLYAEVLKEGDLIAVVSADEIILLAPYKERLPARRFDKDLFQQFSHYQQEIRSFFKAQEFTELKTPSLVPCPGTEPSLDVFSTTLKVGSRTEKLYLPTSPELHLKKALALGAEKVFEIAPCYRNGEITERHQPEFFMLEWYRAYANLESIKADVMALVQHCAKMLQVPEPEVVRSVSVAQLFQEYCQFTLTPATTKDELKVLAKKLKVDVQSAESIDDYFFLIFMEKIESELPPDQLLFVEKYPPYQAALARLTADGWGDRFEVYWKGYELANAFHELNDPSIQRLRSQEDLHKKQDMGKEEICLDEEFFQCLEAGMPPSGGIALGVERLFMALKDLKNIKDLSLFPK